jgi:exopolysaccharide biosynthesis WecB/TagA/CpsF family protein
LEKNVVTPRLITWINHFSIIQIIKSGTSLSDFDYIGVDGIFLKSLLSSTQTRTSADTILPLIFKDKDLNVILIGGSEDNKILIKKKIKDLFPRINIVVQINGYSDLNGDEWVKNLKTITADIIVIGMGSPLQEKMAKIIKDVMLTNAKSPIIFTCGGWLDQLLYKKYYPKMSYPLRINWLIRIIREPRRLWKRYTIVAVQALSQRSKIHRSVHELEGYERSENNKHYFHSLLDELN